MVRESKKAKTLADVFKEGMTVSMIKGLPFAVFLEKKFGFGKAKIVPYTGGISNFQNDENFAQQCFASSEPRLAAKAGIKTKVFLAADEGFNPYVTVVVTKQKTLKEKPDLVKNMVVAMREGWTEYLKNPGSAHETIAKLNGAMDLATLGEMIKIEKGFVESSDTKKHGLGTMTKKRWAELVQQLKDLKLIEKTPPAEQLFVNL
jgi:NitT/TauT family transport system substrate-binding protein